MKSNEITLGEYARFYEWWGCDRPLIDDDYIPESMRANWAAGLQRVKAIVAAMTADEKNAPSRIPPARIDAIAGATGSNAAGVRDLISHFLSFRADKREMLERVEKMTIWQRFKLILGFASSTDVLGQR